MVDYTNSDGFVTDDQGRRQYANRDDAALIEGTEIDATDHNEVRNELVYLVSQSGLTPSNEDLTQVYAAVQKLVAVGASEAAVGFTPVEQGGVTGLTSDKINIGNSTNGLAAYMAGTYYGVLATQAWATGKFVANNGGTNGGIVSATIDGGTKTPSFQDGSGTWTQVASYSGLQAEISRATTVESNLQTSIGQKVDKSGDTMTGPLTVKSFSGITASGAPSSANTGDYINYPAFISSSEGRGGTAWLQLQEHVGTNFTLLMGVASGGNSRYFGIPQGARANDSAYGEVAYTSDLSSYVPSATYASDFATTDTRIINLPYGHIIQAFTFTITTAAQYVAFPVSFSNPPMSVVLCQTSGDLDVGAVNWTSTGFTTRSFPGDLNQVISVIAIGPR